MTKPIDCVCVIHGERYEWIYVENLSGMLKRFLPIPFRLHVFSEAGRQIPGDYVRHDLDEWSSISNTRQAWWYKMQMFDPKHNLQQVLYFDLDVVITGSLDWIDTLDTKYFWGISDWRRLWKPHWRGVNSSIMFWNSNHRNAIWKRFCDIGLKQCVRSFRGDQEFITQSLPGNQIRYFDDHLVRSWRWQVLDGGIDPKTRKYKRPGSGAVLPPDVRVVVFHGEPKPHEISDPIMNSLWKSHAVI